MEETEKIRATAFIFFEMCVRYWTVKSSLN